jgi:hypothetical protein
LLDHSIDVLIGQTSGDDPRPRFASAGYQLIGLDGDRDAIMRVEALRTSSAATLTHGSLDHFALG